MADFTGNGVADLAVLTADGVSIYLGNGKGGFLPPTTYAVPSESDGLTVADVNRRRQARPARRRRLRRRPGAARQRRRHLPPYHDANQAVELAVADLTGNGSKDIIYADQGLDRVVVDYGAGNSSRPGQSVHRPARPRRRGAGRPERRRHPRPDRRQQRQQQRADLPRAGQRPVRAGDQRRRWLFRRHRPGGGSPWPTSTAMPDLVVADRLQRRLDLAGPGHRLELDA